jgi:hypothetical protein
MYHVSRKYGIHSGFSRQRVEQHVSDLESGVDRERDAETGGIKVFIRYQIVSHRVCFHYNRSVTRTHKAHSCVRDVHETSSAARV